MTKDIEVTVEQLELIANTGHELQIAQAKLSAIVGGIMAGTIFARSGWRLVEIDANKKAIVIEIPENPNAKNVDKNQLNLKLNK